MKWQFLFPDDHKLVCGVMLCHLRKLLVMMKLKKEKRSPGLLQKHGMKAVLNTC